MGALLGIISDIHRVRTNLEDPKDIRNDPQQGIHPQATSSSNYLHKFEISFLFSFEKTSSVRLFFVVRTSFFLLERL